jgi:hypothetical protein
VLADSLVRIEIGGVEKGSCSSLHPASRPAGQKVLYPPSAMYRSAVPYDQQLAWDLSQEMPQEANHIFSLEGSLLLQHVKLALQADSADRLKR